VTSFQAAGSRKRERISHFSMVNAGAPLIFEEQNPSTRPLPVPLSELG
jgi:hypothetical protein